MNEDIPNEEDIALWSLNRPLEETFCHDYVALLPFALIPQHGPAELVLRVAGKLYPIVQIELGGDSLLLQKIVVHGMRRRVSQ